MKKNDFQVTSYAYRKTPDSPYSTLLIEGRKLPPPSKRITLHQPDIKILSAKIVGKTKKGNVEFDVIRINHIKSFGEVRLHVGSMLYPGAYEVTIKYSGKLDEDKLKNG